MCVWTQERVREADAGQTRLYRFAVAAQFRYSVQWLSGDRTAQKVKKHAANEKRRLIG